MEKKNYCNNKGICTAYSQSEEQACLFYDPIEFEGTKLCVHWYFWDCTNDKACKEAGCEE